MSWPSPSCWAVAVFVFLLLAPVVAVRTSAGPLTLDECAAAIEAASAEPEGTRIVVGHISRKLRISVETLRAQRETTGLGWGDLLIAYRVSTETGLAVENIAAEFRGGKTWTELASQHRVDVEALAAFVRQSQEAIEQRSEDRVHSEQPAVPKGKVGTGARRGGNRRSGGAAP